MRDRNRKPGADVARGPFACPLGNGVRPSRRRRAAPDPQRRNFRDRGPAVAPSHRPRRCHCIRPAGGGPVSGCVPDALPAGPAACGVAVPVPCPPAAVAGRRPSAGASPPSRASSRAELPARAGRCDADRTGWAPRWPSRNYRQTWSWPGATPRTPDGKQPSALRFPTGRQAGRGDRPIAGVRATRASCPRHARGVFVPRASTWSCQAAGSPVA